MAKTQKTPIRKFYAVVWILFAIPFFGVISLYGLASWGVFGPLPTFDELENPQSNLASVVYSYDGIELGKYYVQNRTMVKYEDLSPNLINALIATEDVRFHKHSGIDFRALSRAVSGVFFGGNKGGGSTISQQLAKLLFTERPASSFQRITQKLREWVIAVKLEKNYTKNEILNMYLNIADFGHNIYGISSASKIFFDKTPAELNVEEAALLIGLLKAPSYYSPIMNPENCERRRSVVMNQMVRYKFLERAVYDSLITLPLIANEEKLSFRIEKNKFGHGDLAPYFLEEMKKDLNIWCKNNINPATQKPFNLHKDGLKIYTTIDSRMQRHAESAVNEWMKDLQETFFKTKKGSKKGPFAAQVSDKDIERILNKSKKQSDRYRRLKDEGVSDAEIEKIFNNPVKMKVYSTRGEIDTVMTPMDSIIYYKYFLRAGLLSVEAETGHIKAWVGGVNFKHFKFDHVRAGKRQVGSTFKPFVYTKAMEEGISPCYQMPNVQVCIEKGLDKPWCPKNSGDYKNGEMVSLKDALANSINYITANLMKIYGPESVIELVRKMGITSDIPAVPSISLGTADISLYEMVGAFNTFNNQGVFIKPQALLRIEDKKGNVLHEFSTEKREVMSQQTAYLMTELLKGVVEYGTGGRIRRIYKFYEPVGGKTGTTQNNSDGWFIGMTRALTTGVWVGGEERSVRFASMQYGQGAYMALPIWAKYHVKVYEDPKIKIEKGEFRRPDEPVTTITNCAEYRQEVIRTNTTIDFDKN